MRDTAPEPAAPQPPMPGELLIWLSPSFPVGGFAYSQGLEAAVQQGWVTDRASLADWLEAALLHGALHNDLILISLVMRATQQAEMHDLIELSSALQPSAERASESLTMGRNFIAAYQAGWDTGSNSDDAERSLLHSGANITFPIAVAFAARAHAITPAATLEAYAVAHITNQLSAAIRLGVVGQFDGQRITAAILPGIRTAANVALTATLDDLGTATFATDLASLLHETQTTRLFRS